MSAFACDDTNAGQVQLEARPATNQNARSVDIRAQVSGPTGLRYKWFSVAGETDPQDSDQPATVFTFADGTLKDRVTVEVWRDGKRVMRNELDVALDSNRALLASASRPKVDIQITDIPPYEPNGGADTRADISGRITGELASDYRVVIYARADLWYRQPMPDVSVAIEPNGSWKTWTHRFERHSPCGAMPVCRRDSTSCRASAGMWWRASLSTAYGDSRALCSSPPVAPGKAPCYLSRLVV